MSSFVTPRDKANELCFTGGSGSHCPRKRWMAQSVPVSDDSKKNKNTINPQKPAINTLREALNASEHHLGANSLPGTSDLGCCEPSLSGHGQAVYNSSVGRSGAYAASGGYHEPSPGLPSSSAAKNAWLAQTGYGYSQNAGGMDILNQPEKQVDQTRYNPVSNALSDAVHGHAGAVERVHAPAAPKSGNVRLCCPTCSSSFTALSSLKRHISIVHEGNKLQCLFCQMEFSYDTCLNKHILNIHPEKGFQCDINGCQYVCGFASSLRIHKTNKHGAKNFFCSVCGKACACKPNLLAHIRRQHPELCFKCTEPGCAKVFINKSFLNNHIESAHGRPSSHHVVYY